MDIKDGYLLTHASSLSAFFCNKGKIESVCLCAAAAAAAESRWCRESLPTFHSRCVTAGSGRHSLKAVFAGRRVIWNQQQGVRKTLLACVKRDVGNKLKAGAWVFDINGLSFSWRSIRHGGRPLPAVLGGGGVAMAIRQGIAGWGGDLRLAASACHLRPCAGLHLARQCAWVSVCSERVQELILKI